MDRCNDYSVIDCTSCGFRHLSPIPSAETLDVFYKKEYYETRKVDYIEKDLAEEAYWEIAFRERLDFVERRVVGRRILDVGCGSGRFLRYAASRGWDGVGIEPSETAAQVGRAEGLTVLGGRLDDFEQEFSEGFDLVHLKNVLEHVVDPKQVVNHCVAMLRPGGMLYVEVPNDYNLIQRIGVRIVGEGKSWICIPDHINYFDFSTLGRLVRSSGLRVVKRDTTFPMYLFLWFGRNFIRHKEIGARMHGFRMGLESGLERVRLGVLKRGLYRVLSWLGLGRTVVYYCQA